MPLRELCCAAFAFLLSLTLATGSGDTPCGSAGDLQLVSGSSRTEGRLNICRNDDWRTVCYQDTDTGHHDFTIVSASVACFQLGYAGAQMWFTRTQFGPGPGNTGPWLKNVKCNGNETKLEQCGVWCTNEIHCDVCKSGHYDVGIRCEARSQVQLINFGISSFQGTVYHYYNNTWSILCDEGWNLQSATVVCNQLGLGKAINYTSSYSSIIHNYLLTNTNCTGDEEFLKDCSLRDHLWRIAQTCPGQYAAKVVCEGPTLNITVESSTPTSISLKWTAADDRFNYYPVWQWYTVLYRMDGIWYSLLTPGQSINARGLKPDTEYTFWVGASINVDDSTAPLENVTYRTQPNEGLATGPIISIVFGVLLLGTWTGVAVAIGYRCSKRPRNQGRLQQDCGEDLPRPLNRVQAGDEEHQPLNVAIQADYNSNNSPMD